MKLVLLLSAAILLYFNEWEFLLPALVTRYQEMWATTRTCLMDRKHYMLHWGADITHRSCSPKDTTLLHHNSSGLTFLRVCKTIHLLCKIHDLWHTMCSQINNNRGFYLALLQGLSRMRTFKPLFIFIYFINSPVFGSQICILAVFCKQTSFLPWVFTIAREPS